MTNHPKAALRALERKWRTTYHKTHTPLNGWQEGRKVTRKECADELAAILSQIEAAPSPPDSSQGEPVACDVQSLVGQEVTRQLHGIYEQREEILTAFIAKYGCAPDEVEQISQPSTGRWWVQRKQLTTPPPSSPQVAVADAYIVKFDDTDREDVLFSGEFAENAALKFFDQAQINWSCYLFRCIAGPHPRANQAAPQSAPKAAEPVEPQARHWREAMERYKLETIDDVERIARELAQAEQK
jgi:hypothetical protein